MSNEFNSIEMPERSIELPKTIQGKDVIVESNGSIDVLYQCWATNLHFEGTDKIRGNAVLRKIRRIKKIVPKKTDKIIGSHINKIFGIFPRRVLEYEMGQKEEIREEVIFEVWADTPHDWGSSFFISDGKIYTTSCSASYWDSLVGEAANQGIILSSRLRPMLFSSIEQKLLDFINQVRQFAISAK